MNMPASTSTRPYLLRAIYEWCTENGFTPYIAVRVDSSVRVPNEYVNNGEIVLNVSFDATSALHMGNDHIEFKARLGGKSCDILVPVDRVIAIYARENGEGMAFPAHLPESDLSEGPSHSSVGALDSVRDSNTGVDGRSIALKTEPHMQLVSAEPALDSTSVESISVRKDSESVAAAKGKKPTLTRIK